MRNPKQNTGSIKAGSPARRHSTCLCISLNQSQKGQRKAAEETVHCEEDHCLRLRWHAHVLVGVFCVARTHTHTHRADCPITDAQATPLYRLSSLHLIIHVERGVDGTLFISWLDPISSVSVQHHNDRQTPTLSPLGVKHYTGL